MINIIKMYGHLFDRDIVDDMCSKWDETREMLSYIDILVDGEFLEEEKSLKLIFKGSANQRTIMVQESLAKKEIVLWQPPC